MILVLLVIIIVLATVGISIWMQSRSESLKPVTLGWKLLWFSGIMFVPGGIRLHDARHTHASLLLKQGVHPKVVQERLGHASIAITLDTYSHVAPGLQRAAAMGFDEFLQAKATAQVKNKA